MVVILYSTIQAVNNYENATVSVLPLHLSKKRWREVPSASWSWGSASLQQMVAEKHAPVCGLSAAQNSQRTLMLFSNEQRQSMWAVRATRHRGRHESRKDCATLQVTRNWPLRLVVTENPGNPEKADWVSSASEELQPVLVCQQNKTNIPGMWLFLRPRDEFSDTLSYGMSSLYFSPTALTVAVTFDSMKH